MRKEIIEKINIPEGIEVEITDSEIKLKKSGKEASRKYRGFTIKKEGDVVSLECAKATKNEKKQMKTLLAHIKNGISGLIERFEYKLQVCAVHFPMNVSIDKAKNEVLIKNFLGGVKPRIAKIIPGVEVKIEKDMITVLSELKEKAGQTAANIEQATRITNRDRRVFQDGIYIIEKPGEKIL
ncbi:MAG: 50S ribosomal protein L6 [Nanoarchaeota archaeon]|nr:50S ribosomal protein L6 [Nanoarchaeota archaeon]MBU4086571.1 50S ribosomal protein L6 [Nanoarchaeota archaeon]